jgi:hypothetical protein
MPDDLTAKLLSAAVSSGLPGLLMIFAIRWLQASNKELLTELNKERDERMSLLESHITECDTDRKDLRNKLLEILTHTKTAGTP